MLQTVRVTRGLVTAPHHLAAEAGLAVLRDGGNAVEATIAAAAAIAVVYPHMNAIGGDGFWLIHAPGAAPVAIRACGGAARGIDADAYLAAGHAAIPSRGGLAANTVAGTVSGWGEAAAVARDLGGTLPLARLLEEAIHHAEHGVPVTESQHRNTAEKLAELAPVPGFAQAYLDAGVPPAIGARFRQPALAATLRRIAEAGTEDFYRGRLARAMAADLARAGSPVTADDLAAHRASRPAPLSVRLAGATLFNQPPPTQGLAALMILGLFERLGVTEADGFAHVHGLVEATKQAFLVRDAQVRDPAAMTVDPAAFLAPADLAARAAAIDPARALPWGRPADTGDTVWLGAVDGAGRAVSFIQSIYWEFGSGVILPETGVLWQNRGASFALAADAPNRYAPGRLPFHTLNPALALFDDGRVMPYGTMGGDGQPQTQAAIFTRYALFGQDLQAAITAPRWLLGRTWGSQSTSLKLESRFDPALVRALGDAGHEVETMAPMTDLMGHAGAAVHHPSGLIEGASDPRSDGRAAGW